MFQMTHGGGPEHRSAADEPCYLGYSAMFGDDRAMRTLTSLDDYIIKHFGASDLVHMIMQEQAAAFTNTTPEEMADHAVRRLEELGCSVIGVRRSRDVYGTFSHLYHRSSPSTTIPPSCTSRFPLLNTPSDSGLHLNQT